jgi:predicted phage baseplate assembly protein
MLPPALRANVRMARYQTGGGSLGNKPPGSIVQIKTTVPYVQRVTNFEDADGGADAELSQDILKRETHRIRHGGRAVTSEDFEDMALLASGEVARALCIPLRDLREDRMARKPCPGVISLLVVPGWKNGLTTPVPPSAEVLARVREYLDGRRFTGAKLVLVGPEYLRIDLTLEITVADPNTASDVELGVKLALLSYFHPLNGFRGNGWDFGRAPAKSELYAFIETLPGVEHVRSLEMLAVGDRPDTEQTRRFLVTPGDIQVRTTLEK